MRAPTNTVLEYVLKVRFFLCILKTEIRSWFSSQAHPNRCFCQKPFTFRDQKLEELQWENRNLPESHDKLR